MNERQRQQLGLIVKHELGVATRALEQHIQSIFADHSARGRLHSGATIRVSVRSMGELAGAFVADLSSKTKAVAVDQEAFEALSATVNEFLDFCLEQQMPPVTRMASGRLQGPRDESVQRAAQELFDQMRADIEAKLAITAFDFEAGVSSTPAGQPTTSIATSPKRGGRPPAEFWDDMWAAIATALYSGELHPKSQADVQRAMSEWIEGNGHSAADSTVKARARRLWDLLQSLDE